MQPDGEAEQPLRPRGSALRRRVPVVLDAAAGTFLNVATLLAMDTADAAALRVEAHRGIRSKRYRFRCASCAAPVELCGGPRVAYYFAHHDQQPECPWYRGETISAEELQRRNYAVITESRAHLEMKERIAAVLASTYGSEAVRVEHRVDAEAPADGWMTWRKPDVLVSVTIAGRPVRLAVEVQLSSTHVGVVVDRHDFYARNGIYLLWIFAAYPGSISTLSATCVDIVFLNNANAFVFDAATATASAACGALRLRCHVQRFDAAAKQLVDTSTEIGLDDLVFDERRMLVYSIDGAGERAALRQLIDAEQQAEERTRLEAAARAAAILRRDRIHACLDALRDAKATARATAKTAEALRIAADRQVTLLATISAELGVDVDGDRRAVLCTVGSLATSQFTSPLVGWNFTSIVEALHYHFRPNLPASNRGLLQYRFLIRCAMLTWFREGLDAYERRRRPEAGSLRERVTAFRNEPHLAPDRDEIAFINALRPLYPEMFPIYDDESKRLRPA